jgi:carbohydrate kinase (thermoresistant glucokinase family)
MVYIVIGVSGSGKTTIGEKLSTRLGIPFYDADSWHPDSNINKMKKGLPLDDNDRMPWLQSIVKKIDEWNYCGDAVLSCSALKESYRDILSNSYNKNITYIFLNIDKDVAVERLNVRANHFFPIELLNSQFDILEKPDSAITINANNSLNQVCDEIYSKIIM